MDEEDDMSLLDVICDSQALNDFLHGCNKVPGPSPSVGEGGSSQAAVPAACAEISELEDDLVDWSSASTGSGEVTGGNLQRIRPEKVHIRLQTRRKEATQHTTLSAGLDTNRGGATLPQQPPSAPRPPTPTTPRPLTPTTPGPLTSTTPGPLPTIAPRPLPPSTPRPPTPGPLPTIAPRPLPRSTPRPLPSSTPRPLPPSAPRPLPPSAPRPPTTTTPRPLPPSSPRPLPPSTIRPFPPAAPRSPTPAAPRPATPDTTRPLTTSNPRPPTPSATRPPTPATPRPATPATPRPLTPSTPRSLTPSTPRPSTPATTRPPTPATPSPPLPQPANPRSINKSSSRHCLFRQVGLSKEQPMASVQTTSNGSPGISSLGQASPPVAMSSGPIHQQLLAKPGCSSLSCCPASPLGNQVTPSSLVCVLQKGTSLPRNSLFANASLSPPTQPVTFKPATTRQVVHPPPSSMNVVHRAPPAIQPKHCLNIQTKALQRSPKPSLRPNSPALHNMEAATQQQTAVLNPTFPVDAPVRNVVLPPWASSPMTGQTQPAQPRLDNPTFVHVPTQASTLSVPQPVVPAKRRFILPGHLASVVSRLQPLPAACAGAGFTGQSSVTLGLPRQPAATHIVGHQGPSGQLNAKKPSPAQILTGQSTAWHRTNFGQVSAAPGRQPVVGGGRAGVLTGPGQLASSTLLRVPTHPDADFPQSRSSDQCVRSVVQPMLLPNRITVPGDTGPTEHPVTLQQLSAVPSGSCGVQPRASRNAELTPGLGLLQTRTPPPCCPHAPAQLQGSWHHPPPLSVTPPQTGNTLAENTGQCISQLDGRSTLNCDQLLLFQQKERKQQLLYRQVLKMQQERGLCLTSTSRLPVGSAAVPAITSGGSGAAVPANAVPMEAEILTAVSRPQSSLFLPVLASQLEEPVGSLKQSVETIQKRDNLLLERFCKDQTSVMQPDCNTPFHSIEDTVLSLLPYHVCEGAMPSSVDFIKVDEEFQVVSANLLKQTQAMQNKYRMLLFEESRRTKSSAEMVMINRMFIQEEKVAFLEARQLARDSPDAYISSVFQPDIDNSPPTSACLLVAPNTLIQSTKQLAAPELDIRQARIWPLDAGVRAPPAGEDPVVSSPPSPPKIYTVRSRSGLKLKIKQEAGYNQVVHHTEFDHLPVSPVKQLSGTRGCTPSSFNHSNRACNCTVPSLAERRLLERLGTRDLPKQRLHLAKGKMNRPCCCSPILVPDPTRTYLPQDSAASRLGDDQKVSLSCCPLGTGARHLTSDSRNAGGSLPFRTRGRPGGRWGDHTSNEVEDTIARGLMEVDSICHLPWELSLPRPKRRRSESEENGSFSSDSPQDSALNQHLQSAINSILDLQRMQTSEEETPELAELSTPPCSPSSPSEDFMQQEQESGIIGAETSTLGEIVNST
ncbi:BRD4-interacting chromatin-remodeling complex-associated protein-like [Amblyraja radiata]|uniref:BRD4-interacting chromatin-remodeling complex-associated protein-like n=1 Tax=Amblyraja radiata TaxID=386614 RepID=UPI001403A42B|nr:BRD4-interacting chromatin-remodeling complex-associated protein-like [Amblyraja radiata]